MRFAPLFAVIVGIMGLVTAAWLWNPIAGVAAASTFVIAAGLLFVDFDEKR